MPLSITRVVGVGGEKHLVLGKITLPVKLSGIVIDQIFIVLESLHHTVVLGLDFMNKNKPQIDSHNRKFDHSGKYAVSAALICDSKLNVERT